MIGLVSQTCSTTGGIPTNFVEFVYAMSYKPGSEQNEQDAGHCSHRATRAALRIPDDPSALSFLLTGIVQVEPDRKQALLEAATAEERLRDIDELLDRELKLLGARLAPFAVDRRGLASASN